MYVSEEDAPVRLSITDPISDPRWAGLSLNARKGNQTKTYRIETIILVKFRNVE